MKIYRLLALAVIPILMGACSLAGADNSTANNSDQIAQDSSQPNEQRRWRGRTRPNFAEAAQKLGVTEAKLKEALGVPANTEANENERPRRPRFDIKGAAAKLGVTEEQLVNALGLPPRPNFAEAAKKLGVTEATLKEAVGVPTNPTDSSSENERPRRPRLDIKGGAAKLGVTEEELTNALGIPPRPQSKE